VKKQKIEVKKKEVGIKPNKPFKPKITYYWFIAMVIFAILIAFVLVTRCVG